MEKAALELCNSSKSDGDDYGLYLLDVSGTLLSAFYVLNLSIMH